MPEHLSAVPSVSEGELVHKGVRIRYEVHGKGPRVIVYLHGLLLDANFNRQVARLLAQAGNRVVLLDLPGHGKSDKPRHASAHRMDSYSRTVVALLDHLGVESAVIGGVSLGANVALQCAVQAPSRVRALVIEMPVLEWAVPGAILVFLPLLLGVHYAAGAFRMIGNLNRLVPRTTSWVIEGLRAPIRLDPEESAAVLHGLIIGPIAPTVEQRRAIDVPALVIGHRSDFLHPFSDAQKLVDQLANSRLVEANSIFELRVRPRRIVGEITTFLVEVWEHPENQGATAQGATKR